MRALIIPIKTTNFHDFQPQESRRRTNPCYDLWRYSKNTQFQKGASCLKEEIKCDTRAKPKGKSEMIQTKKIDTAQSHFDTTSAWEDTTRMRDMKVHTMLRRDMVVTGRRTYIARSWPM